MIDHCSFGLYYRINGHRVGHVMHLDASYRVTFERCFEENTLEEIEKIDWKSVTVELITQKDGRYKECPLPEGYSFSVKNIEYQKYCDAFIVTLTVDKQYWGDVTPYQAQIDTLTESNAEKDSRLAEMEEKLSSAEAQLTEIEEAYDAD